MAELSVVGSSSKPTRTALRLLAAGVIDENFPSAGQSGTAALTSQRVYASLLGLRAGDSVVGVVLRLTAAAAGTNPTLARFGIADSTGKMLALSSDLGAPGNWTTGAPLFPFTAPYVPLVDGGYYACFVVNGTWGTTQPSVTSATVSGAAGYGAVGAAAMPAFTWDTQTDLPAINSSLTMSTTQSIRYSAFYGTAVSA